MSDSTESPLLRMYLLGEFRISMGIRPIAGDVWKRRKAATLLKVLALTPTHRLHREQVLELLWPESDVPAAHRNLHHTLHVTRRILGAHGSVLRLEKEHVFLEASELPWIDVEAFESLAARARHTRSPADFRTALALYTGDLLPDDLYEEWALERRAGLRALALGLLLELATVLLQGNDSDGASQALERAVQLDAACEEAHTGLMRIYSQAGQRHRALRQYEELRQALRLHLDVEPGEAAQSLYIQVQAGAPVPTAPTHAPRSTASTEVRHNLPVPVTSFIGREHEVREIQLAFTAGRLLTLTGIGGSGKTRLALEAAGLLLDRHEDGVWLVELGSVVDPTLVPAAVAHVFGVTTEAGGSIQNALSEWLRERRVLLLLDNCEHVIDAVAELTSVLLARSPQLHILATSREALRLPGEMTLSVPPLRSPGSASGSSPEALLAYDAIRLLVDRARLRDPNFQLDAGNAPAAVSICRQVEGIPLAIELAAARTAVLSLQQIEPRLRDSMSLLSGRLRASTPRQHSLVAALTWSYNLLTPAERILFRRLAVFARGWTLEAAQSVLSGEEIRAEEVLDLLTNLVDKSLVMTERREDGHTHHRLLEPVRQFARDLLEQSGELDLIQARHASFLVALLESARLGLTGPDQPTWLHRLDAERDNLRSALTWSESANPDLGFRLASLVWFPWYMQGHVREAREWLDRMFAANPAPPLPVRVLGLRGLGATAQSPGEYDRAIGALEEALAICRDLGDDEQAGRVLNQLAIAVKNSGDLARATALHEESLALRRKRSDRGGMAESLVNLGSLCTAQGDWSRAETFFEEALALEREFGDHRMIAIGLNNLGELWLRRAEGARAEPLFTEALTLGHDLGEIEIIFSCLDGLARCAAVHGRWKRAGRLHGAADTLRCEAGFALHGDKRAFYDLALSELRAAAGEQVFTASWNEGAAMEMEEAVAYALARHEPTTSRGTPEMQSDASPSVLSAREHEVALLVSQGLTNRQIAGALTVAERTVDTHVSKILRKLQLSSRVQLARWVLEH